MAHFHLQSLDRQKVQRKLSLYYRYIGLITPRHIQVTAQSSPDKSTTELGKTTLSVHLGGEKTILE